jgi:hypothetical protein
VKGTANFGAVPGKFSLKLDAMGEQIDCPSISYSVDHSTGQLALPQASDKRTCLGKVLADAQLPVPKVKFDGKKLSLDLGLAKLDLTPCS